MKNQLAEIDALVQRFLPQNKAAEGGPGSGRHAEAGAAADRATVNANRDGGKIAHMKAAKANDDAAKAYEKLNDKA